MKNHPASELFPIMDKARYAELLEDIRVNGQRVSIMMCDGMVLDGRNRYKVCEELGMEPKTDTYTGNPYVYVWSLNGTRRDLTDLQRAIIKERLDRESGAWEKEKKKVADDANKKRSDATKEQPRTEDGKRLSQVTGTKCPPPVKQSKNSHPTREAKAKSASVSSSTQRNAELLINKRPDLADKVAKGEMKGADAIKTMRRDDESRELEKAQAEISDQARNDLEKVCDIRHCSMRDLLTSGIKPDCIITDPPYPQEFLPLYGELAELSKDIPLVAVMCGQSYLPDIIEMMCRHLKYRWTIAYLTPGGQAVQQWDAKVNAFWKPVLLFGKALDWIGDVAKSDVNDNDKRFHGWGQSESGMADIVERLTKPGQLVCDPFCGAGTTAVACFRLGRRFVGCDIDESCVEKSKQRCIITKKEV